MTSNSPDRVAELVERLTRKRDRVHPANRRSDLPMGIKLTFGDLETLIGQSIEIERLTLALDTAAKRLNTIAGVRWAADRFDPYDLPEVETLKAWAADASKALSTPSGGLR